MTKLQHGRPPLRRETAATRRRRTLIIELHPLYLTMWQRGLRERVAVDYEAVYDLGLKLKARENFR